MSVSLLIPTDLRLHTNQLRRLPPPPTLMKNSAPPQPPSSRDASQTTTTTIAAADASSSIRIGLENYEDDDDYDDDEARSIENGDDDGDHASSVYIVGRLKELYRDNVAGAEKRYHLHYNFRLPTDGEIKDSEFDAAPMVLLIGQYSTGKVRRPRCVCVCVCVGLGGGRRGRRVPSSLLSRRMSPRVEDDTYQTAALSPPPPPSSSSPSPRSSFFVSSPRPRF